MIAEAVDTAVTVAWALLAWITAMAVVATVVLYAVAVTVWAVGRVLWRAVRARWPREARCTPAGAPHSLFRHPRSHRGAPRPAQGRTRRPTPAWAHTQPHDSEEAA